MRNLNALFSIFLKQMKRSISHFFHWTDGQIYLYRFIDNGEEEEPGLENIEEDEEFDRVSAIFNEWLDTQDFGDIDLDALDDLED
jgi:hypothetical protein